MKVLIVCDHASYGYGGEAQLPLHWFKALRDAGADVALLAHGRSRSEIERAFPEAHDRVRFVDETVADRWLWAAGRRLPHAVDYATTGFLARLLVQRRARAATRRMVAEHGIDIVHQPTPVSPCEPSLLRRLGAPLVIGPMNGGMDYPPAFVRERGALESTMRRLGRSIAPWLNRIVRGKADAALLIVANERTFHTLPFESPCPIEILCENGVDLTQWTPHDRSTSTRTARRDDGRITFVCVGRLVKLKAVDLLIDAFYEANALAPIRLLIVGDGPERADLERQARARAGTDARRRDVVVQFTGHLDPAACAARVRDADAMVFPSVNDCGGAVVLEAMASGLPVIATAWGGALEYVVPSCGILVPPHSRRSLVTGFAAAITRLADATELRRTMGALGRNRAAARYSWPAKARRMLGFYRRVLATGEAAGAGRRSSPRSVAERPTPDPGFPDVPAASRDRPHRTTFCPKPATGDRDAPIPDLVR